MRLLTWAAALAVALAANAVPARADAGWDAVVAKAKGETVYWNAWGGDERTNGFIAWVNEQVRARYGGVSLMWIFRKTRDDGFPAPIRFGDKSRRYWRLSDLIEWEARILRADTKGKAPTKRAAA